MWNLIIIGIVLVIVTMNIIVFAKFSSKRKFPSALQITGVLLLLLTLVVIIIPNFSWIKSPIASNITGKVIDAKSGEGIQNVNILVAWRLVWATVGGGSRPIYENYSCVTDDHGKFSVPSKVKPLSFVIPFIADVEYGGLSILAYDFNHVNVVTEIQDTTPITLTMSSINDEVTFLTNINKIEEELFFQINDTNRLHKALLLLADGYRLFEKKYSNSSLGQESLLRLSHIYDLVGDATAKESVYHELLAKYPTGTYADYVRFDLARMRR